MFALTIVVLGAGVPVIESGRIDISLPLFVLCGAGVASAAWAGGTVVFVGSVMLSAILLSVNYLDR
jgi:hypothetical protein